MHRVKLCMNISSGFGLPLDEQIRLLKKIGFEGFFVDWKRGMDIAALRSVADEEDMLFQSIHAPFNKSADMWEMTEKTEDGVQELIECLQVCRENAVPIMVAHVFQGFTKNTPTPLGIENYSRVVREAERLGVIVAFENTEGEAYLAALMEAFQDSPNVGFCWDTGHEMCYNYSRDMLALYGDKLVCTHLNDNIGIRSYTGEIYWHDDLHLLPFDGAADWQDIVSRLNRHHFEGPLTFELTIRSKPNRLENEIYARMPIEEYLTHAYIRACRVGMLKLRQTDG